MTEPAVEIDVEQLKFDINNPRFGLSAAKTEPEALHILRDKADLRELIDSISERGFERYEPLVGWRDPKDKKITILEGNRRLAAVKILRDPKIARELGFGDLPAAPDNTKTLPVVLVANREEADDYIAFKHINGPNTWDPLAKAKFATKIFFRLQKESPGDGLLDILSRRIGDSRQLVLRLLVAYQILQQAVRLELIHLAPEKMEKLDFSHLYTTIQSPSARVYLGLGDEPLSVDQVAENPVPKTHRDQLEFLMDWLFGTDDEPPIIQRQGTDRPKLVKVLASPVAVESLQSTRDFERAVEEAGFGDEEWMKSVTRLEVTAKRVADGVSDLAADFPKSDFERGSQRLEATTRHVRGAQLLLTDRFGKKK